MSGETWAALPVAPDVAVMANRDSPELDAAQAKQVDALWGTACARNPRMFNGRVFSVDSLTADRIEGHWTEYKRAYAQLREPGLFGDRPVRALAVNGLLSCPQGIVLGRRSARATYLPGGWQTPPAGSVEARDDGDGIDLAAQVLAEAEEELGVAAADLSDARPFVAVTHPRTHVIDIGIALCCRLDAEAVAAAHAARGNDEYEALRIVPEAALPALLRDPATPLLPTARTLILHRFGGG